MIQKMKYIPLNCTRFSYISLDEQSYLWHIYISSVNFKFVTLLYHAKARINLRPLNLFAPQAKLTFHGIIKPKSYEC